MATKVEITTTNYSHRATSLRARITDVVTLKKCGTNEEFRKAMNAFDDAVAKFKASII